MPASSPTPPHAARDGAGGARPLTRAVIGPARRLFNPIILRLAGSRRVKFFAVVRHRGRRSGRLYATPVSARPTADGFAIGLTFGERADWVQNLRAAGGGVIRWNGAEYAVTAPAIVDWPTVRPAFSRLERALVPLLGIQRFAHVQLAPSTAGAGEHDLSQTHTLDPLHSCTAT
jgi:deazaflavin-dependent oxidoreductase (nitroreductase family)